MPSLNHLEKLTYLGMMSGLLIGGGWTIYKKNVLLADERAEQIKKIENKFLAKHPENMIKLQNFK